MRFQPRLFFSLPPPLAWLALALLLGLAVARWPWVYSLGLLGGLVVVGLSIWEPTIGLGLAVILGPAKAYLAIAYPAWPSDVGQLFFALALAGWLLRGLARRTIFIPQIGLLIPLGLYMGAGLLSLLSAQSLEEAFKEILKWFEIALGLIILYSEMQRHPSRARWLIGLVLVAGLCQAAIGVWQFALRDNGPAHFRILGRYYRAYGSFEQPNPYAGFLGLIWPLSAGLGLEALRCWLNNRNRPSTIRHLPPATFHLPLATFLLLTSAFLLFGLYISFSRGAWLGAAAAGLTLIVFLPRQLRWGVSLVTLALLVDWALNTAGLLPTSLTARLADVADFATVTDVRGVNINDSNFALIERLAHWQAAVSMTTAHPWFGVGLGNYAPAYPHYALLNWPNALGHAHMLYLNVWAETGLLGLATYSGLWLCVIGLTMRLCRQPTGWPRGLALGLLGAWAHVSLHHLFDNLYVNNLHFLFAALLALLTYHAAVLHPHGPLAPLHARPQPAR